ncbi:MAG: DUF3467 domain-containing protein [bacterium]
MENTENKNNNQELKIKIPDDQLRGSYSNAMQVSHTKNEFVLDFFSAFRPEGILVSRVIMSPAHLKNTINALRENIANYESKFGVITEGGDGLQPVLGFHPDSQSK